MLTRHHSILAVPAALTLPVSWLLPVGIVSHLIMDKLSGVLEEKYHDEKELITHIIILIIAVLSGSVAIFVWSVICFNLPDLLRLISKRIDLHNAVSWTHNRLELHEREQSKIELFLWVSILLTIFLI